MSKFPKEYLEGLEQNHREKIEELLSVEERILMYSGARLNWIGEFINNKAISWELKTIPVDNLTLTGTGPEWNAIILDRAEGRPDKFRELLKDPEIRKIFKDSKYIDIPILVRKENDKLKILDGMNRTIAAIRDDIFEIRAYIGTLNGNSLPVVEPHVVYDFIRAYQRGGEETDFVAGLRFLANSYSNVKTLLEERFNGSWVRNEKVQKLIGEILGK
jgi:hypothetical protein